MTNRADRDDSLAIQRPSAEPNDFDATRPMRGLGRQGLLNASATIVPGLYSLFAIGAILHTQGTASYAVWATAVVLLGWVNLLDFGLGQTVVRASARAVLGDDAGIRDVRQASAAYAALGLIAALIGFVMALLIPVVLALPSPDAQDAVEVGLVLGIDAALVIATAPWAGILRGTGRFGQLLVTSVVQVAVSLPLLIVLLPSIGLVGAAIAQIAGRLASRAIMAWLLHGAVPWFRLRPGRPTRSGILRVARFSAPIFIIQVATQIGTGTDVLIVGVTSGAASAGLYAAGAQLVRYLAYFLFPLVDVVYPRLSSIEYFQPRLAGPVLVRSLFLAASVGTVAFGGLALEGAAALTIWSGQSAALSVGVLVLYAVTYAIITPAHVLVIALIARGRHRTLALVILAEAVVNLVLSIWLALTLGPIGPAVSTLIVVAVDDILIIPWLASRRLDARPYELALAGFGGAAVGIGILTVTRIVGGDGVLEVAVRAAIGLLLLGSLLIVGLRRRVQPAATTGDDRDARPDLDPSHAPRQTDP